MAAPMHSFRANLDELERRFSELDHLMADPAVATNAEKLMELGRERADMDALVTAWREYKSTEEQIAEAETMANGDDSELAELAQEEIKLLRAQRGEVEDTIRRLLVPKDPYDEKNVIVEIRAGTGGDEAALFAADLFRMYTRYSERSRWKVDVMSSTETDGGGFREVIFEVKGKGAYSYLRYESGVHRVQRVPATESQGRIHTSTASVAVLPEAEEVDVQINDNDLRIDVFRSTGHGGQSVNTTDSAVRITHLPTGLVVQSQDQKSQLQNKAKAMLVLRSRLLRLQQEEREAESSATRKSQVGGGGRGEKIRTYNFKENRVTDHRIGLTVYALSRVLDGDLDEISDALVADERARLLAAAQEEAASAASDARRLQVRTVDRSERIRTYNYAENRISDHRVGFKAYNLDQVLDGELDPVIQANVDADVAARLAGPAS